MNQFTAPDFILPAANLSVSATKRVAMLEAATELFITQGYGAVSMDAVARRAGVSKATLYAHFGTKDRLFAAIIEAACAAMRGTAAADAAAHAESLREALLAMGRHWLEFLLLPRSLAIFRIVVAEGGRFPELAESFMTNGPRQTRAWLTEWISAQIAAGRLRRADAAVAADQFLGLLRGEIFLRAALGVSSGPEPGAMEATVVAAADTFCRAFAA